MVAADDLAQVKCNIGDLIVQDPAEVEEGRGIADDPLSLADGTVPVRVLDILGRHFVVVPETSGDS